MEIHEIETAIILAEAEAKRLRDKHKGIADHRTELKKSVEEIRNEYAEKIYEIQRQMEKAMQDLQAERTAKTKDVEEEYHALSNEQWESQLAARKAEQHLADLERMLDQAKRATLKAAEFQTLENRWDLMTMGAPWREWAKDHQISGAKKVTYEGRMILGDTMGLGKTLTSLIAIDMIEAATKDASEDNPVNFGSMD